MSFSGILSATRVVTGWADWAPGWVEILDGRVVAAGAGAPRTTGSVAIEGTILPGFVDIHAHGAVGADFGRASLERCRSAADYHASRGTTTMLASLASASIHELRVALDVLHELCAQGDLAGIHLEGPYLSERRRGAHNPALLRRPDPAEVEDLLEAGQGSVRVVTIAPELDGAEEVIRLLVARSVRVAVGHTDCDAARARAAFDWGATIATHLFNGMPELEHRNPGPVGAALADSDAVLELILDGHHVSREVVEVARRAAPDRYILVSDAMAATGQADGLYEISGSRVRVSGGVAMLADGSSLAGSTKTIFDCLPFLLGLPGVGLLEAVQATAIRPAVAIGIEHPGIQQHASADLVVVDFAQGTQRPSLVRVMRRGQWLE